MTNISGPLLYLEQTLRFGVGQGLDRPEPPRYGIPIDIGDVGFIQNGAFCRLFNVLHPEDSPVNSIGVPRHYQRLELPRHLVNVQLGHYTDKIWYTDETTRTDVEGAVTVYAMILEYLT